MIRLALLLLCLIPLALARSGSDVTFAEAGGKKLLLDFEIPEGPGPYAAVIIVHGGGFLRGDKRTYVTPMFPLLSGGGYAWFSINYRMAQEGTLEDSLNDVRSAIRYVQAHAKEYNIDPRRVFILGESAGGSIVALIGVKDRNKHGLAGIVDFYGVADFVKLNADRKAKKPSYVPDGAVMRYFGAKDEQDAANAQRQASALTYMGKGVPPMLLIHGTADEQVFYDQSPTFCPELKRAGNECELFTVPDAPHGMSVWEKDPRFHSYKAVLLKWLDAHSGKKH